MIRDDAVIEEINNLWFPIYPYMADYLLSIHGEARGRFLDLGPFAGGLALEVLCARPDMHATVLDEAPLVLNWVARRAGERGCLSGLHTRLAALHSVPEPDGAFDLIAVRGAFFFLTAVLLREINRLLRPGGFAWIGGGYGPKTPLEVIAPIAERSRFLNEAIGKKRITEADAWDVVETAGLQSSATLSTKGGLWIELFLRIAALVLASRRYGP